MKSKENHAPGVSADLAPLGTPDIRYVSRQIQKIRIWPENDCSSPVWSDKGAQKSQNLVQAYEVKLFYFKRMTQIEKPLSM